MISLLYVSRGSLAGGTEDRQLADILTVARARNAATEVSGALIYAGGHFAQVLEGEAPAVNQLTIDILRDRRHNQVRIIEVVSIARRRFAGFSMASVPSGPGPHAYLEALTRAGSDAETSAAASALLDYMVRFSTGGDARR